MNDFVDIGLPEKMEIKRQFDSITIIRKWFGWNVVFITIFAVIWNSIILKGSFSFEAFGSLIWIQILVGVAISYYAITGWFNKTDIYVTKRHIQVNHKPLPWFGNKRIDANDIKQLYCKEIISRNNNNNSSSISYEVHVIMHKGNDTKLLSGLNTSEQAIFIEQEIEKYLGIQNKPVRGELG